MTLKHKYDLVITDPPSFAPNENRSTSHGGLHEIFSNSIRLVQRQRSVRSKLLLEPHFDGSLLEITREAFSKAKKRGTVVF